ncbi:MAG: DUF4321 domain-containing protein [Sulfobacillus acidophilus]|uniref:DUF4321 domain-containing protein n=1 Tax=Sulfobacillus acidophilus TaxID=53633 RepID=A0A2T2WIM0_9FIRM|nr:MAG: DUF4321 domain-containing protein [Sulfobacillus acidophilus]
MHTGRRSIGLAILYIIIGGVVGSIVGQLLQPMWPVLGRSLLVVGSEPGTTWTFDLGIMGVRLGAWMQLNLLGMIGVVVGLIWYQRSAI